MSVDQATVDSVDKLKSVLGLGEYANSGDLSDKRKIGGPIKVQPAKSDVLLNSLAVFSEKGINETTVQDLLDAAKISRRTFYKYFKNKIDVLQNLYKISVDLLIARFRREMSSTDNLGDLVYRCIDVYFDYHVDLGPMIRMMQEEAMRSDSPLYQHREKAQKALVQVFDSEIRKIQGRGFDPWAYYSLMWSLERASLHLLNQTQCTEEDVVRCKSVMRGVMGAVLVTDPEHRPQVPDSPSPGDWYPF